MTVLSNEGVRKQNPQRADGHTTYLTRVVVWVLGHSYQSRGRDWDGGTTSSKGAPLPE